MKKQLGHKKLFINGNIDLNLLLDVLDGISGVPGPSHVIKQKIEFSKKPFFLPLNW